jgi:hypothetical protein
MNYEERGQKGRQQTTETDIQGTFSSIDEFVSYGGLDSFSSISSNQLANDSGVNPELLWCAWDPLSRVIYDQGLEMNGTVGNNIH